MTDHNAKAALRLTLAVWVFVATNLPTLSHAHDGGDRRHRHGESTGTATPGGAPVRHQHLGLFGADLQLPAPPAESDHDGAPHAARLAPLDGTVRPADHPLSTLASDNGSVPVLGFRLAPPTSILRHRNRAPGALGAGTCLDRIGVRRC